MANEVLFKFTEAIMYFFLLVDLLLRNEGENIIISKWIYYYDYLQMK